MSARLLLVLAAALALSACFKPNVGGQTATTTSTASATQTAAAPQMQKPQAETRQANISDSDRQQLESLIHNYLDNSAEHNAPGFGPAGISDEIVSLQPGADYRWVVNLTAGASYRVIGVCDNECSNIDMELYDPNNQVVSSDTMADDLPIVNVAPAAAGPFTVRIIMRTCTVAPCFVGARVLQQGAAASGGKGGKT